MSTVEQIKNDILKRSENAVKATEQQIHTVIDGCLVQYYHEFTPEEYIRTGNLLHSLVTTGVISTGNGFEAKVYFDASQLNYENGVMPLRHTPEHGRYGWATWGVGKVLDTAMHGSHGGYKSGTAIWDESMAELGDIVALIASKLRAAGLPIK